MKPRSTTFKDLPLDIVGSLSYGRYSKISVENTFNMIVSDDFLVDYAGFKVAIPNINADGKGRGAYKSARLNRILCCIGNGIYLITPNLSYTLIGQLSTFTGDVFFAEDNQHNIQICDKQAIYNYNSSTNIFQKLVPPAVDFRPGYICFHDTRFISVDLDHSQWRLSDPKSPSLNLTYPNTTQFVGAFETKPDIPLVVYAIPGKENNIIILGSIVGEYWTDQGLALFPYVRNTGVNIDYGISNSDTFATLDNYMAWLGINDRSGPVIMISRGAQAEHISNDGIDFKLASLTNPQDAHGFMFKQDGHIFYQLTFPTDNFSLAFDFNTGRFFTITDAYMNYHPAKNVVFFNNTYYFVSLNDGSLYEMSTNDTTYAGLLIPRVRVTKTVRLPDTSPFVVNNLSFVLEQGIDGSQYNPVKYGPYVISTEDNNPIITQGNAYLTTEPNYVFGTNTGVGSIALVNPPLPAVDLAISNDGGASFSNFDRMILNPIGLRRNRFIYYNLSWCNEFTSQFRFWSQGRIVAGNGALSIYQ